ncbi:MAG: hypothetical protein A2942_03535 [Candidatus Lloydbacteria bacterium RIFCSPLOWO2_01_FULL_50_20]|uniref:Fibronectin type-III domain-containing protein n=1 Tax=Candidatus Lloydbacteria bacterium RIFCSPLOWO2_01_FULL_50_20 TaxID=1798665 RepID=A0A1G2DH19_9BACT|nr:MAG: hypothetical protein A3C13_01820 [Candidatus Lloydbacteria bacterium RIFCSPHIGHO2_02_FULL_50_11]OGZ12813.1 MAG: hypothetical protein A2942_03535 [Candidatus Lloydbacteria bacterium RIFCSPLOWO2_01_FULL_50_20]
MKYPVFFGAIISLLAAPLAFAVEAAPYMQTFAPTFLTEKSVQLNGRVNPNEMPDTYEWFEWGISGRSDVYETAHRRLWGGNSQISTSANLIGLAPSTQYFYRAVSENGRGKSIGATIYFTTKQLSSLILPIAVIETKDATFVGDTAATIRGYVSPHGNSETKTWFEWGTTATMENRTPETGSWGESSLVTAKLTNLMPGTLYYFRAVAENAHGRSYGIRQVFLTTGTASSQQLSETPRDQEVVGPAASGDSVTRTVTTSGSFTAPGANTGAIPPVLGKPGDFFSALFGGKKTTNTTAEDEIDTNVETNATDQVAAAGSSGTPSNILSGKKSVEVVVQKIGPKNVAAHTPIEYHIAYAYRLSAPASDAILKITLPVEVIYIGDNTNNELLLDTSSGPERTYVLLLGHIEKGSTRTISILGMTTGDAKEFPDARVRFEYTDKNGTHAVAATNTGLSVAKTNIAGIANSWKAILPSSLVGWIFYVLVVVGAVFGIRKIKSYYREKKKQHEDADERNGLPPHLARSFPGAEEISSQRI